MFAQRYPLDFVPDRKTKAAFIEPMMLLRTEKLPEGKEWLYELKLDGYRALAIKRGGKVHLRSRNDNDFNMRYPDVVKALTPMPDDTVIDGEVVALDEHGRPSFNTLQNHNSAEAPLHFFIFDVLILGGRDVMGQPLTKRRKMIQQHVLPKLADPILFPSAGIQSERTNPLGKGAGTRGARC
jgi:ATP-dependent DNA ligase